MRAVLQAITTAAVDVTGAEQGWLLLRDGELLRVLAAAGTSTGPPLEATTPVEQGTAGFVISSNQPMAIAPKGDDPRFAEGVTAMLGRRPVSVLAVPCGTEDSVLGVLELVDKVGGTSFSFDDVELATLLGGLAGVALQNGPDTRALPATPTQLAGALERLQREDPARYATVAGVVTVLLALGD